MEATGSNHQNQILCFLNKMIKQSYLKKHTTVLELGDGSVAKVFAVHI